MDEVEFYDKQVQYEESLGKIQQERSKLEREFHSLVRSDNKLQSIRLLKLKSYWKQVCEREKKARIRNEELLRDFSEMENKFSTIHARTTKLKRMKKEYEEEITKLYPKWRQEVEISKAKRQLEERGFNFSQNNQQQQPTLLKNQPLPSHGSELANTGQQQGALFQLVPYTTNNNQSTSHSVVLSTQVSPVTVVKPQNVTTPSKNITSTVMSPKVSVPPLNLPSSGDRDLSDHRRGQEVNVATPDSNTMSNAAFSPKNSQPIEIQQKDMNDIHPQTPPSGDSTSHHVSVAPKSPEPLPSAHIQNENPRLKQVEVVSNEPSQTTEEGDRDKNNPFFTYESSISDIDEIPSLDFIQDNSRGNTARSLQSLNKANQNQPQSTSSPLRSPHKLIVPIPSDREGLVQESLESVLSETLTTETSPRTDAPLTSSAAYKQLKQQHNLLDTFDENGDFVEDYAEDILSPKSKNESSYKSASQSDSESDVNSTIPKSPIVKIPTAVDNGQTLNSSRETNPSQLKEISSKKKAYKAPWDSDSSEDSFEYDNKHNAMDEDDFDFYD